MRWKRRGSRPKVPRNPVKPLLAVILFALAIPPLGSETLGESLHEALSEALNAEREARGLGPLAYHQLLTAAAQKYAAELLERGELSHIGLNGERALARYRAEGGSEIRVGEILGSGPSLGTIVHAWMESEPHRLVLLDPEWNIVGTGIAERGSVLMAVVCFAQQGFTGLVARLEPHALILEGMSPDLPFAKTLRETLTPDAYDPLTGRFSIGIPRTKLPGFAELGIAESGVITDSFFVPALEAQEADSP